MTIRPTETARQASDCRLTLMNGAYFAIFLTLWMLLPLWIHDVPPSDNFEQLEWAKNPAWGYAKHPPFPSLLLWLFAQVFPSGITLTYALGALDVAVMLIAAVLLARETLDPARAILGALLITCISFYTRRLHFYNHNTALLAAYAASLVCLWRAVRSQSYGWWTAVGVCWAIGLLSKYQMIIGIASNLIFIWDSRSHESRRWLWGALLAGVTAGVLLVPHGVWLFAHDFPPMHYAAKFVAAGLPPLARPANIANFIADQILRLAPLGLVAGALYWKLRTHDAGPSKSPQIAEAPFGRRMLAIHAWGPLALMVLLSLFFGVDLEMHWGTAFLWVLPLWFLATPSGRKLATLRSQTVLGIVVLAQLLMLTEFAFLGL